MTRGDLMKITNNPRDYQAPWSFVYTNMKGKGLEIAPLHNAIKFNQETTTMEYADYMSRAELIKLYEHRTDMNVQLTPKLKYKCDAHKLHTIIEPNTYDFLVHSHMFEHLYNPVAGIESWLKVVKPNGYIYFILPDMDHVSFDRNAGLTSVDHLVDDYISGVKEVSQAHYIEFVQNSDDWSKEIHKITETSKAFEFYDQQQSIHVHRFKLHTVQDLLARFERPLGYKVLDTQLLGEMHICCLLQKGE